eukprot:jgi/Bigna1/141014/aug1.59_g15722
MEDNKQGSGKEEDEEEKNGIGHSSSSPSGAVRRGFFVATAQPDPRNIDTRIASTDEDGGETERVVSSDIGGGGECGAIEDEEKNEVSLELSIDQPLKGQAAKGGKLLGQAFEVRHLRATTLPAVGLQLWMGSLVLMDYLLAYAGDVIEGKTVLELGM